MAGMYHRLVYYSPIKGHLGCFQLKQQRVFGIYISQQDSTLLPQTCPCFGTFLSSVSAL